jgi:hypothetical protein
MSEHIKTIDEMSEISIGSIYFNVIKYGVENLKKMQDQYGLTFLHYYFLTHSKLIEYINKNDDIIYNEIVFLIKEGFDFAKQTKEPYSLRQCDQTFKTIHSKVYTCGNTTPFHMMVLYFYSNKKMNIEAFANLLHQFDNHIEDSLGLTPIMYAIQYNWSSYIEFAIKDKRKLLSPKLENKKQFIIKMIEQKKEKIKNSNDNKEEVQLWNNLLIKIEKDSLEATVNDLIMTKESIIKI